MTLYQRGAAVVKDCIN